MGKIWTMDFERIEARAVAWLDEWPAFPKPRKRPPVFRVPEMAMKQQEWRYLYWMEALNVDSQWSLFNNCEDI